MEWFEYTKSGKKPIDIPSNPSPTYAKTGWAGWGDWLGTGRARHGHFRPFKKARALVRALKLKSQSDWRDYCKSGKKPADIPASPHATYAKAGWIGYDDWLETGRVPRGHFQSFRKARAFARRLGLKSEHEWRDYYKSGKKPADIPANPNTVYAKAGWAGMGDWLGTGTVAPRLRHYRSFRRARAFVRGLGLKSEGEWRDYCKSGKKPADIPADVGRVYANNGWLGMRDWLGNESERQI